MNAHQCQVCDDRDCAALYQVTVPTDDTVTVPAVLVAGSQDCIDEAIRELEGWDYAIVGFAQVDRLNYLDGAA